LIPGVTGSGIAIASTTLPDSGLYELEMHYSRTFTPASGPVNQLLYPFGALSYTSSPRLRAGLVDVSLANCPIGMVDEVFAGLAAFPNPVVDRLYLRREGGAPLTWEVMDLRGVRLQAGQWTGSEMEVDVRDLPAGLYMLRLQGKAGQNQRLLVTVAR